MQEIRIEIPQHIRRIKVADSRRAVYYIWDGRTIRSERKKLKIPRKFYKDKNFNNEITLIEDLIEGFYIGIREKNKINRYTNETIDLPRKLEHGKQYFLCELKEGKLIPVVANLRTVGTPGFYLISGQDIHNGSIHPHKLSQVMREIKDCFRPFVEKIAPITEYPIGISCELHDTIKNVYGPSHEEAGHIWDVDNYIYPYNKAFPDLLQAEGKIRQDDRLHIPQNIHTDFFPIENHAYRKLVYIIRKITRPEIIDNRIYKEYHNKLDAGFHKLNNRQTNGENIPDVIF